MKKRLPLFSLGIRYALWFIAVAAAMGVLYGLIGGVIIYPAIISVIIVGIFATINFVLSLLTVIPMLILRLLGKRPNTLIRYFSFSLAFFLVFLPFFALVKVLPLSF